MLNKVFDSIATALSTFVLGWAMPSVVTVGTFAVFVFPEVESRWPFDAIRNAAMLNVPTELGIISFFILILAVLSAHMQVPIYRLLEGYAHPRILRRRLHLQQLKRWRTMQVFRRLASRHHARNSELLLKFEQSLLYPDNRDDVQPTRLGNALRAMETYAVPRFGLDSQTLWYELVACAPARVVKDVEETRATVDLFVSAVMHFSLLAVACFVVAIWARSWQALVVGLLALFLTKPAYNAAVRNVGDYRFATQALIHTARKPLAEQLGFRLPRKMAEERTLWRSIVGFVYHRQGDDFDSSYAEELDRFRA